jgi:hypothetical protein
MRYAKATKIHSRWGVADMKLLERYPDTGNYLPNAEARLVAAYRKSIREYQSLIGVAAQYLVPTLVNGKIVPVFDESKTEEVHKIYDQMATLQQITTQLKQRIDEIDKLAESFGENIDIQSLNNRKKIMEQEIVKSALVPEVLKKRQKEYAQIVEQIESYKVILGDI